MNGIGFKRSVFQAFAVGCSDGCPDGCPDGYQDCCWNVTCGSVGLSV